MIKIKFQSADSRICGFITLLLLIAITQGCASSKAGKAAEAPALPGEFGVNIWNDPVFKKQFIASYGINSEIEPRVTAEEIAILEKIRPLRDARGR